MKRTFFVVVLVLVTSAGSSVAKNSWLTTFNNLYNTNGTRLSSCCVCHTSVPAVNAYGNDFLTPYNNNRNVTAALQAIEGMDSDNDKVSNIVEIGHLTFPGDPGDTAPTEASTWGAIKALYN
jgi:hypothetical protein